MAKFYAVARGRTTGIFTDWSECFDSVNGFSNAKYESFKKRKDAERFLEKHKRSLKNGLNLKQLEKEAENDLKNNQMHYKDKPVNGSPTDKQIDFLKSLCKRKKLEISIIGITKKEASELIDYLNGKSKKKPACYKKYIKE